MAIDTESVRIQQRELSRASDEISAIKRRLSRYQELLDKAWKGPGIKGMDSAIEETVYRLNRLVVDLEELGHDVMAVGEEVKLEESV